MQKPHFFSRYTWAQCAPLRGTSRCAPSRVAALLTLLALAGCTRSTSEKPADVCTKMGQTCSLGTALLGVCNEAPSTTCKNPPCYVCVAQH
jgi:hypothetical protein